MAVDYVERKVGELTVEIDRRTCIGSGNCVKVAPDLFRLDDEGIAAFAPGADHVDREALVESVAVCPVEALRAKDASGRKVAP
jgi:ferredoxin